MKKRILSILLLLMLVVVPAMAAAAKGAGTGAKGRLLFIPHDNRPISKDETAEVVQKLGYEVVMPPEDILSNGVNRYGQVDKLWDWMESHLNGVDAAMVSTDTMIYGGLVPSRNHELSQDTLMARAKRSGRTMNNVAQRPNGMAKKRCIVFFLFIHRSLLIL